MPFLPNVQLIKKGEAEEYSTTPLLEWFINHLEDRPRKRPAFAFTISQHKTFIKSRSKREGG